MSFFADILKSVLFGVVQGITEWLPISSTGHMILLDEFITLGVSDEFKEMFFVVIQLGSALAVLWLFFDRLDPFSKNKSADEKKGTLLLWLKVAAAVIPSAAAGLFLDDFFDEHFYSFVPVSIALIAYGVLFIALERYRKDKAPKMQNCSDVSFGRAFLIGSFQVLSLIPGTSRSGSTILGAMLLGLSRTASAEFSFFMALPTMAGASGLKVVKFLLDGASVSGGEALILALGTFTAFLVSLAVIKFLLDFVRRHDFVPFGIYRIALGGTILLYFFAKNA